MHASGVFEPVPSNSLLPGLPYRRGTRGFSALVIALRARVDRLGLLIWMIGLWLVAARFARRAFRPLSTREPA